MFNKSYFFNVFFGTKVQPNISYKNACKTMGQMFCGLPLAWASRKEKDVLHLTVFVSVFKQTVVLPLLVTTAF